MEAPQTMQISGEEGGEEFYEKIEAPKFVDFTAPDQNRPDDCYWFCLRVGCDQKHEEEMDSEAIYKNFVLRVIAARSPNVRLRKALYRKALSANVKCPLTAPPKPSKSRISRLALISSISHKPVDTKLKARPTTPKLSATPGPKAKHSSDVAKAHTTPRNRKRLSNPNTFRSVRNPKVTTIVVPKNRVVAKALVFKSPKKAVKTKTELNTPMKSICAAMKKLEITSEKKHVLGYNKSLPIDASRKQLRGREVKSRVYESLQSHNRKVQEAKTSRCKKRNIIKDIKSPREHMHHEGDDDSSDMDIDEKSRDGGSLGGCSLPGTRQSGRNGLQECLKTVKSQEGEHSVEPEFISLSSSGERDSGENDCPDSQAPSGVVAEETSEGSEQVEKIISSPEKGKIAEFKESGKENAPPGTSQSGTNGQQECLKTVKSQEGEHSVEPEFISLSSSEERDSGENDCPDSQAPIGVAEETSEGSEQVEKIISSPEKGKILEFKESDKENALACDDAENDNEANENDEKENAVASDDNRLQNHNNGHQERLVLGEHDTSKFSLKINRVMGKAIKEGCSLTATTGAQGVKQGKPKPTNPKPFRLRTDERGILKEANLEKKLRAPGLAGTNSQRKHQNASQKKKKSPGKSENECHTQEGGEKELDRTTLQDQAIRVGRTCLKAASKGKVEQKLSLMTLHRRSVSIHHKSNLLTSPLEQDKASQKQQNSLKKTPTLMTQQKLARPRGSVISSRKETVSLVVTRGKLGVVKENSSKILTPKQAAKPFGNTVSSGTKASSRTTPRSLSRGIRPTTIPKEPNFHSIHTPKSCTRKQA